MKKIILKLLNFIKPNTIECSVCEKQITFDNLQLEIREGETFVICFACAQKLEAECEEMETDWDVDEIMDEYHILPNGDIVPHIESENCHCQPVKTVI